MVSSVLLSRCRKYFQDLNMYAPASALRKAMLEQGLRVVAQEYGPLPHRGLLSAVDNWEKFDEFNSTSPSDNHYSRSPRFSDFLFVTTMRDPKKRLESHLRYAFPRCIRSAATLLRRCIIDNDNLAELMAETDPRSGSPMLLHMEFPYVALCHNVACCGPR